MEKSVGDDASPSPTTASEKFHDWIRQFCFQSIDKSLYVPVPDFANLGNDFSSSYLCLLLLLILSVVNKAKTRTFQLKDSEEAEAIAEAVVVTDAGSSVRRRRLPLLMLAPEPEEFDTGLRRFYCLETGVTWRAKIPYAANLRYSRCFSSKGWLLTLSRRLSMSLVHPFTGVTIPLPDGADGSLDQFEDFFDRPKNFDIFVQKFVLTSPPSADVAGANSPYTVAIIFGGILKLALWRSGDDVWTRVTKQTGVSDNPEEDEDEDKDEDNDLTLVEDIVYYRGEFYAIGAFGMVFACGFDPDRPEEAKARLVLDLCKSWCFPRWTTNLYLVVSCGKLLVVSRELAPQAVHNQEAGDMDVDVDGDGDGDVVGEDTDVDEDEGMDGNVDVDGVMDRVGSRDNSVGDGFENEEWNGDGFVSTGEFVIFRVTDLDKEDGGLELVTDLGDESLFLGDNQSISIKASECPGCKPNCIYFTDDWYDAWPPGRGAGRDMGIYNLKDGSIEPYYQVKDSFMSLVSPTWVDQPSL